MDRVRVRVGDAVFETTTRTLRLALGDLSRFEDLETLDSTLTARSVYELLELARGSTAFSDCVESLHSGRYQSFSCYSPDKDFFDVVPPHYRVRKIGDVTSYEIAYRFRKCLRLDPTQRRRDARTGDHIFTWDAPDITAKLPHAIGLEPEETSVLDRSFETDGLPEASYALVDSSGKLEAANLLTRDLVRGKRMVTERDLRTASIVTHLRVRSPDNQKPKASLWVLIEKRLERVGFL
jgi:hypothetical protein